MCTASVVWKPGLCLLTFNRDEHINRAFDEPSWHNFQSKRLYFAKDHVSGGTWLACSKEGYWACILNGAEIKHQRKPYYEKSRGELPLMVLNNANPETIDLSGYESFTLLVYNEFGLKCYFWNETDLQRIDYAFGEYLWASRTLYTEDVITRRRELFNNLKKSANTMEDIVWTYHNSTSGFSKENALKMIRTNGVMTRSITQIKSTSYSLSFKTYIVETKKLIIGNI